MVDVDTGQLLGVAMGGLIAAGTAWLTTSSTTRASREMAREQRAAAQTEAAQRYLSDTLHELQVAVLQAMRALGDHAADRIRWIDRIDQWDEDDPELPKLPPPTAYRPLAPWTVRPPT